MEDGNLRHDILVPPVPHRMSPVRSHRPILLESW